MENFNLTSVIMKRVYEIEALAWIGTNKKKNKKNEKFNEIYATVADKRAKYHTCDEWPGSILSEKK